MNVGSKVNERVRTHFSGVWKGALSVCRKRRVDVQAYVDYNVMLASHIVFYLLHIYIYIYYNSLCHTLDVACCPVIFSVKE